MLLSTIISLTLPQVLLLMVWCTLRTTASFSRRRLMEFAPGGNNEVSYKSWHEGMCS
ncbi:hypothetical protein DAEQUDRAFT_731015 [Daedalea quercina L-15889]|uniref:Uncharacterized protein n=1 Tax=Daedalea quercina L-15889 TaxID=1314783 RepID=A0A165MLG0_9APHY|nr:hypothetical protein DAEQUDRAFT_731015 [Daedalea quercina L-15889]